MLPSYASIKRFRVLIYAFFVFLSFLLDFGSQAKADDFSNDLELDTRFIPTRSVKEQPGSVGISESFFNYDYTYKAFGKLPIDFTIDSREYDLNNSTAVGLPAHLTSFTTGIETTVPFFNIERTYFHAGVYPSFLGDNWTFSSAQFRLPSKYVIIYKLNDQWAFLGGVAVYPDYNSSVIPIAGLVYKPSDKLTFYLVPDKPYISYELTEKWTLFGEGWIKTDDEFIYNEGSTKNAVLRYNEGRLGTGIKYKINKNAEISLIGGAIFMNDFNYLLGSGKIDMENGPYVELRLKLQF